MPRNDALKKLKERLENRRRELLRAFAGDLVGLQQEHGDGADSVDAAAGSMNAEVNSRLAEFESQELRQIQAALNRMRVGSYGDCEVCGKRIPIARLNALPYASVCVECQREAEEGGRRRPAQAGSWRKLYDAEANTDTSAETPLKLTDLEYRMA